MTSLVFSTSLRSAGFWGRIMFLAVLAGIVFFAPWDVEQKSKYGTTVLEDSREVFYPTQSSTYVSFRPLYAERTWQDAQNTYHARLALTLLLLEIGVLLILLMLVVAGRYEW